MATFENVSTLNDSSSILSVTLHSNPLKGDGSYCARVTCNVATFNNILSEVQKDNVGLDPYMLQFATIQMQKKILDFLQQGKAVNLFDLGTLYIAYKCNAKNKDEAASKGSFTVRFSPTTLTTDAVSTLSIDKVTYVDNAPTIARITDVASGEDDTNVPLGSVVKINGSRLKLRGEGNGIFFAPVDVDQNINSDKSTWVSVSESLIFRNMPSELNFIAPDTLEAGKDYRIVVLTTYYSSKDTSNKELLQAESAVVTAIPKN